MASFNFPPELLAVIASQSDVETLKALRLTNHALSSFATECLFSEISLYTEDGSCQAFESIITHPQFKDQVRKVYLNTVEEDYGSYDGGEELELPHKWQKLLLMLPNLSNLESVVLRFDQNCAKNPDWNEPAQSEDYRETLVQWLGAGLASLQQPLKELGIRNQQNVTPLSDEFKQVLPTLESLRLNTVHELVPACPENEIDIQELHEFYGGILASDWLKPTMGSLRRLSLYSNLYWGFYPKFSLEGIHFPNLQSLALGNFTFFEDKQLDWILSHSSTLEEIYLDDCPIIFDVRMLDYQLSECPIPASEMQYVLEENGCDGWRYYYPRRWSDYFASFEAGLPHLRHFATGHSEAWDFEPGMPFEHEKDLVPVLTEARYIQFNGGLGPSQFITPSGCYNKEWPVCDDEDREAFKSLLRKIDQQVNCGEFTIGNLEVENLVELHY